MRLGFTGNCRAGDLCESVERLAYSMLVRRQGINEHIERFSALTAGIENSIPTRSCSSFASAPSARGYGGATYSRRISRCPGEPNEQPLANARANSSGASIEWWTVKHRGAEFAGVLAVGGSCIRDISALCSHLS